MFEGFLEVTKVNNIEIFKEGGASVNYAQEKICQVYADFFY